MTKNTKKFRGIAVLLLTCCMLAGCDANNKKQNDVKQTVTQSPEKQDESKNTIGTAQSEQGNSSDLNATGQNTEQNENLIVWTMPDGISEEEMERNVFLVNEKLEADGFEYQLKIQTVSMRNYNDEVTPLLENGKTDIASLGMQMGQAGIEYPEDLVRAGHFQELSSYLASEEGKKLKQEYTEKEWKTVKTDGGIYCIPNQRDMGGGDYFFAFNSKYVSDDMLQNFNGSAKDLMNLMERLEVSDSVNGIIGDYNIERLAALCGKDFDYGVLFDLETCEVTNPYTNELFCQGLRELNELYRGGYLKLLDASKLDAAIKQKNFVVWLGYKYSGVYDEVKEDMIILPAYFSLPNTLSCTTGICKNSNKKEAALQLLTLLLTDAEYGNLLIYGKEGEDFLIKNGYTYDRYGEDFSTLWRTLFTGVYDHVLPSKMDSMTTNRREKKNAVFNSEYCLDSSMLGFQVDTTRLDVQMLKAASVSQSYYAIWMREDFETALQEAELAFEEAGGGLLLEELRQQVQKWRMLIEE